MQDHFEFEFPVWTIVDLQRFKQSGLAGSVTVMMGSDGIGRFLSMFTDVDLAKRFIEDCPLPGKGPLALATPKALLAVLSDFEKIVKGEHVGIDVSSKPKITGRFYPVREIISRLQTEP
jgi:hypothetical protein